MGHQMDGLRESDTMKKNNVFNLAYQCLSESVLDKKLVMSVDHANQIISDNAQFDKYTFKNILPGRPGKPVLINPRDLPRRNVQTVEGKAAMLHAFAHIEFNAINLAWDLICRFQDMPQEFYRDWASVAAEETQHFILLQNRLRQMGYDYGDFPAHDGLWQIAEDTKHDVMLRLGVVPRILEARGLDVTPDLINRFSEIRDNETVSILSVILEEEIGHVKLGTKWFRYLCDENDLDSDTIFKHICDEFMPSNKTNRINQQARLQAGFSHTELQHIISN